MSTDSNNSAIADAIAAPVKRRDFLKAVGVGGAAAAAVGCYSDQVEKLIPYVASPDETVPGVSTYYASTCRECAAGCGIIVETRDGRAIKIEGNPAHPVNRGALCGRGQAALQGLYNPDRFRSPMKRQGGQLVATTWDDAISTLSARLAEAKKNGSAKDAVFINQHEQGSFPAFLDQWLAGFGMPGHIAYDAEAPLSAIAANKQVYGTSWPGYDFNAARLIVSFGADYLDGWGLAVPQQLAFADARAKIDGAPRVVYIGARRSLTGINSDTWIPARPGTLQQLAEAIAAAVTGRGNADLKGAAERSGVDAAAVEALVAEIKSAKPSLLMAGGQGPDATAAAVAVNELNKALGNVGQTVKPAEGSLAFDGLASHAALRDAAERMAAGRVPIAFVRGADPAHAAPGAMKFADAFAKVPFKVSFSTYPDDTTQLCDLVLPDHHSLESWGDAEPVKGTLSLQQPTMDPVFSTRATADVLIAVAKADPALSAKFPANYRAAVAARVGGNAGLTAALPTAIAHGSSLPAPSQKAAAPKGGDAAGQGDYFLQVYQSPVLGDGRGANKPWLQELPDPVTKIAWQTVVELHPETARKLSVEQGDHVTVTTAAGSLTAPAYLYIGIRPDTVAVATGRGHTEFGRYARGCGSNAMGLLGVAEDMRSGQAVLAGTRAAIAKASGHSKIVTTEGSARQHDRGIAQAITIDQFRAGETGEHPHVFAGQASTEFLPGLRSPVANDAQGDLGDPNSAKKGQYDPNHWSGVAKRRWAMVVDLARCTGCSACVTACYAENNIPTVGAPWQGPRLWPSDTGHGANILRGREMAWLRLERYFEIDREPKDVEFNPAFDTRVIPMMCQHCGNAPCEPVCPVYATYHSPDGLNVQVYNRCVGTRYCSNGCPYKVRYFNWFGYGEPNRSQYAFPEPLNWQLNPDVTVRGKGVMEKCTFCLQRIREAENRAKLEGREVKPDEFTVACAQACPSKAITFGDAADEQWAVARMVDDKRAYHVFEELNTYTAVVYLRKVNHPAAAGSAAEAR
ncbi:MAG: 4Fe-4S dicluster domain-containing protein [Gemmatimonadaceae bacterium]|nr:4Fe-4S dicluster domain-containing protein [Gemmatimonadaceae bacterium]